MRGRQVIKRWELKRQGLQIHGGSGSAVTHTWIDHVPSSSNLKLTIRYSHYLHIDLQVFHQHHCRNGRAHFYLYGLIYFFQTNKISTLSALSVSARSLQSPFIAHMSMLNSLFTFYRSCSLQPPKMIPSQQTYCSKVKEPVIVKVRPLMNLHGHFDKRFVRNSIPDVAIAKLSKLLTGNRKTESLYREPHAIRC